MNYSSSSSKTLPKQLIIDNQEYVCITDTQFNLVLIGFKQRELYYNQLILSDDIIDNQNTTITYLNKSILNLEQQQNKTDTIINLEKELTRKEKRKAWWKAQTDKLIIGGLSAIAAIEAALIIRLSL